uniref:Uncharacterized protein n=1 Tax=Stegastes partitus TaxID=144197 RepID=A0A3B4ZJK7_9TELE
MCRLLDVSCSVGCVLQVLPIWQLSIPLPAILLITISLYMVVLGIGLCIRSYLKASSCDRWDCACTCQPPECESCNCLCFEIRIK